MASPAAAFPPDHEPVPPPDPQAIRACLMPSLAAEFDSEWEIVLERAKQSKDLTGVHALLSKWRHTAYLEMRDPGSYYRMLAKAKQIMRTGHNPDAVSFEGMQALIRTFASAGTLSAEPDLAERVEEILGTEPGYCCHPA